MPSSPPFENVLPANADTLLTISGLGTMLYQARGLTQTLEVIKESQQLARTINGQLIDMSVPQFRKYLSKVSAKDVTVAPIDNLWPGMEVTVECAAWLSYVTGNSGSPFKAEVSGSSYVMGAYTFYRPVLTMRVTNVSVSDNEWAAESTWNIELEEV